MSSRDLFLGIDPGASGGVALLTSDGDVVTAAKMPDTERDLCDLLREFGPRVIVAHIEAVHSMPKQGVKSSFTFGVSYGGLRMALVALDIPFESVTPQRWQKEMNCLSGGDKNRTKARAQELFPPQVAKVKWTHATSDAVLIAEHARRTHR